MIKDDSTQLVNSTSTQTVVGRIIAEGENYGRLPRLGEKILVEYVSADPNGLITVGSARGGVIGDVLCNLLDAAGYDVYREFYVNDAANSVQMQHLGKALEARYLQALGQDVEMPDDGYKGDYVIDIARQIVAKSGDRYVGLPKTERAKVFTELAEKAMLALQKEDLAALGVKFDNWYSERRLYESGKINKAIDALKEREYAYEDNSAVWLKSTTFGDEKDRALIRRNGQQTNIASDAAYHADKFQRGFDRLINVWGPQHQDYVARTKAAAAALGYDPAKLDIIIYQTVRLFSDGELVMMSKRSGELIPLSELVSEIGKDAARFGLLSTPSMEPVDLDLEQAKQQAADNPLFRVSKAFSEMSALLQTATGDAGANGSGNGSETPSHESEMQLEEKLAEYPDILTAAASSREPHRLAAYAVDLADTWDTFSNAVPEKAGRQDLVQAAHVTLGNTLRVLGLEAPRQ